jgi:hypothetical protein
MDSFNAFFAAIGLRALLKNKYGFKKDGTPKDSPDDEGVDGDFPP